MKSKRSRWKNQSVWWNKKNSAISLKQTRPIISHEKKPGLNESCDFSPEKQVTVSSVGVFILNKNACTLFCDTFYGHFLLISSDIQRISAWRRRKSTCHWSKLSIFLPTKVLENFLSIFVDRTINELGIFRSISKISASEISSVEMS